MTSSNLARWFSIAALCAGCGGVAPDGGDAPPPVEGKLQEAPCPFTVPAGHRAVCGTVGVKENRAHPTGRLVGLSVAIFKTANAKAAPDPLVYLEGGPGGAAVDSVVSRITTFDPYLA